MLVGEGATGNVKTPAGPAPVTPAPLVERNASEGMDRLPSFSSLTDPQLCQPRLLGRLPAHIQERLCRLIRAENRRP